MPGAEMLCVYQFKVVLRGISPMIWRRLLLRSEIQQRMVEQQVEEYLETQRGCPHCGSPRAERQPYGDVPHFVRQP